MSSFYDTMLPITAGSPKEGENVLLYAPEDEMGHDTHYYVGTKCYDMWEVSNGEFWFEFGYFTHYLPL